MSRAAPVRLAVTAPSCAALSLAPYLVPPAASATPQGWARPFLALQDATISSLALPARALAENAFAEHLVTLMAKLHDDPVPLAAIAQAPTKHPCPAPLGLTTAGLDGHQFKDANAARSGIIVLWARQRQRLVSQAPSLPAQVNLHVPLVPRASSRRLRVQLPAFLAAPVSPRRRTLQHANLVCRRSSAQTSSGATPIWRRWGS